MNNSTEETLDEIANEQADNLNEQSPESGDVTVPASETPAALESSAKHPSQGEMPFAMVHGKAYTQLPQVIDLQPFPGDSHLRVH